MTKKIVLDSLLVALLLAGKEIMAFLPNIEIVTLFLIIFSISMDLKDALLIAICFATIENLLYGFGLYSISYYFVWLFIVFISYLLKNYLDDEYKAAFLALAFGLLFDLPFSIPFFTLGFNTGIAYLMNGLLFSLVHAVGNFIICLLLFKPLLKAFKRLLKTI